MGVFGGGGEDYRAGSRGRSRVRGGGGEGRLVCGGGGEGRIRRSLEGKVGGLRHECFVIPVFIAQVARSNE